MSFRGLQRCDYTDEGDQEFLEHLSMIRSRWDRQVMKYVEEEAVKRPGIYEEIQRWMVEQYKRGWT